MDMQNRFDWKNALNTGVVIFFMFIFRFLPPFGGLSTLGMQILGTFIGTLYGWIMIGIGWPSFLGLISFALTDYCSMSDIFCGVFWQSDHHLDHDLADDHGFCGADGAGPHHCQIFADAKKCQWPSLADRLLFLAGMLGLLAIGLLPGSNSVVYRIHPRDCQRCGL